MQSKRAPSSLDSFDIDYNNLPLLGNTQTVGSDIYGTYNIRCVAHLDWFPVSLEATQARRILDKYHPMKWCGALALQHNNPECRHNRYVALWVALDEDNLDRYKDNEEPESSYVKYIRESKRRNKNIPVAISTKDVRKNLTGLGDMVFRARDGILE